MKYFAYLTAVIFWVAGINITPTFWGKVGSFFLPPVSYYHLSDKVMQVYLPELLR